MLLYEGYQAERDLTAPVRAAAGLTRWALGELPTPLSSWPLVRGLSAVSEMVARSALTHVRPPYGIESVVAEGGEEVAVREVPEVVTPFGTLLHFAKDGSVPQPRVLLVTALAGHFSTLLRQTIATLLVDFDVYATDWHNARDVPAWQGPFGLDDYIDDVMGFLRHVGPGVHLMAVCQPCPAALAAVALMAEDGDPATPRSMTLMAGPIDTRVNPTQVNEVATTTPHRWFEENVITTVPLRYAGAGRRVYPGFLQVAGFMSLNAGLHIDQHVKLFDALLNGEQEKARRIEGFYDEYFAVLDMPAEFYLETIDAVFQRNLLPRGLLEWRGRRVDPAAITRTALLTVEGERDDICGMGQTLAAHDLCKGIPRARKRHHLQAGVGHYGVFSGTRWQTQIYPVVRNLIVASD
jgi:polyhydroxyalkanoate depolymerase